MKHRKITAGILLALSAFMLLGCSCVSNAADKGDSLVNQIESSLINHESSNGVNSGDHDSGLESSFLSDSGADSSAADGHVGDSGSAEGANGVTGGINASGERISEEEAVSIALNQMGLDRERISQLQVHLEYDDARSTERYDIEFTVDQTRYEFEIDARDGAVLEYDIE